MLPPERSERPPLPETGRRASLRHKADADRSIEMDLVLFSGYAKLPSNTTAQKIYDELALVVIIDMETGVVHSAECTMVTGIAKDFVNSILVGYSMEKGIEPLVSTLEHKYHGHLKRALVTAVKMVGTEYAEMKKGN
jgi:hypothetical protein